jgi:pyruvate/2-oxoglutarate dehydrogenase complex dihydrolipoamide acyltransferase (E2) component
MAHEIIMPALGMAQETGTIVSWIKQPGDAVKSDEILLEVETDKTTMEIEAGFDGVVAYVSTEVGVPIPVGQVIAVIAATNEEAAEIARIPPRPEAPKQAEAAPPPTAATPEALTPPAPAPAPVLPVQPVEPIDGRILASPKARRLARERGIELSQLASQGIPQPFHAADLDRLHAAPTVAAMDELSARVEAAEFDAFHRWAEAQAEADFPAGRIWAAFAAACFRRLGGEACPSPLNVQVTSFGAEGDEAVFSNPDQTGLLGMIAAPQSAAADFAVLDLSGTPLTNFRPGGGTAAPTLIIARPEGGDAYEMKLHYSAEQIARDAAVDLLIGLAERTRDPLRQLL